MSTLPEAPRDIQSLSADQAKIAAWEILWDWCCANGIREHSFQRQEIYGSLNGPQMVAQWVLDLKGKT